MPEDIVLIQPIPVVRHESACSGIQTYRHLRKATKTKASSGSPIRAGPWGWSAANSLTK
jgi:hypothetical protein